MPLGIMDPSSSSGGLIQNLPISAISLASSAIEGLLDIVESYQHQHQVAAKKITPNFEDSSSILASEKSVKTTIYQHTRAF
jgi:hypothetical protein